MTKKSYKAFFALSAIILLASLPSLSAALSKGNVDLEKWREEILKYLPEVLLGNVGNTKATFLKSIKEENAIGYKYFLTGSWGAGSATIYIVNGKEGPIKYELVTSLARIDIMCLNSIKNLYGIKANLTLGKYQTILAEAFPGTAVFGDAIKVDIYFYWNATIPHTNLTVRHDVEIGKASVLVINNNTAFCALQIHPYVVFPPKYINASYLVKTCDKIFNSFIENISWKNETVTEFQEEKDLLGEMGGSVFITTQGPSSSSHPPGSVSISMNNYGQITAGAMGRGYEVNATYIQKCGGIEKLAKKILGRDYLRFLELLANFSRNPSFKTFISEIAKTGYGYYLGVEYSSFIIKMEGKKSGNVEYRYIIQNVNGNVTGTLGEPSFGEITILKGKDNEYTIFETGDIRILKAPRIDLNKVSPKLSFEKVRSEVSSLLRGNYSIDNISLHYVPRISGEFPEYCVNCSSSAATLEIKISGLDGKILDISYSLQGGQTSGIVSQISHRKGILIIEIGVTIAAIIGITAWAIMWRRKKKLGM